MTRPTRSAAERVGLRRGWYVFGGLAALTALENGIAALMDSGATMLLALVAVGKGWLILDAFMHIRQLAELEEGAR